MSLYGRVLAERVKDGPTRRPLKTLVLTLYVFDMDDTLIRQPHRDQGAEDYQKFAGKPWPFERWWSVPQSLLPPFTIKAKPGIKGAYQRARQDYAGKVIVMTGRLDTPEMRKAVLHALKQAGYSGHKAGDDLFLKNPNTRDTAEWKKKMLRGFMRRWPSVTTIRMWDDRGEHVEHFRKQIAALGREAHVVHVTESWPNTPPGALPYARDERYPAKGEKPMPEAPVEEPERPLDSPGPGNVNARTMVRAAGSKMHTAARPVSAKLYRRKLKTPVTGMP